MKKIIIEAGQLPELKIEEKPSTASEEIKIISEFINYYQDEADRMTGKIS